MSTVTFLLKGYFVCCSVINWVKTFDLKVSNKIIVVSSPHHPDQWLKVSLLCKRRLVFVTVFTILKNQQSGRKSKPDRKMIFGKKTICLNCCNMAAAATFQYLL